MTEGDQGGAGEQGPPYMSGKASVLMVKRSQLCGSLGEETAKQKDYQV